MLSIFILIIIRVTILGAIQSFQC